MKDKTLKELVNLYNKIKELIPKYEQLIIIPKEEQTEKENLDAE